MSNTIMSNTRPDESMGTAGQEDKVCWVALLYMEVHLGMHSARAVRPQPLTQALKHARLVGQSLANSHSMHVPKVVNHGMISRCNGDVCT